ncbi:hypothetical protein GCM10010278_80970 [Streptomyces melanogenes]|nr:hypothetical protein GCM10010278_80970 [Streptomyces melanogenes]
MTTDVFIDSFGARWQDAPPPRYRAAVLSINLTNELLNPPDDPAMADAVAGQTGLDADVSAYVLNTPGAARIIDDAFHELTALLTAANGRPVQLLVNCWYGRHRAPAVADAIGRRLHTHGLRVAVTHHHIDRPPVPRKHPRPGCPFCAIVHDGAPAAIVREWPDTIAMVPRSGGCTDGHRARFQRVVHRLRHFPVGSRLMTAMQTHFNAAASEGKWPRARTARRMRAFTLSIAWVVHTILRISASNCRNGTNSAQVFGSPERTIWHTARRQVRRES